MMSNYMANNFTEYLRDLINSAHSDTWDNYDWVRSHAGVYGLKPRTTAKWKTPGEPAFVSRLLEYSFAGRRLAWAIEKYLEPRGLCNGAPLISGVFIHQKPKVSFGRRPSSVELGDLLLVRQHFQLGNAVPTGRAFLIQAKSSNRPQTDKLTGKEAKQFSLYADWSTSFVFPNGEVGDPPDHSPKWNFSIGPMRYLSNTGCYGLVANTRSASQLRSSFPENCMWAVGDAKKPPKGHASTVDASELSLSSMLEGFLRGARGRPWVARPRQDDHWSTFITRMLQFASRWHYPIQRLGETELPRLRHVLSLAGGLAFPLAGYVTDARLGDFWPYARRRRAHAFAELASRWTQSLARADGGDEPPSDFHDDWQPSDAPGGISVLYVATCGPEGLPNPEGPVDPQRTVQPDQGRQ